MIAIPLLLGVTIAFTAAPMPSAGGVTKLKVAAALPGIITDKGWNQAAYEALKQMEKQFSAQIAYTERVAQTDQTEVMSDYARRLIMGISEALRAKRRLPRHEWLASLMQQRSRLQSDFPSPRWSLPQGPLPARILPRCRSTFSRWVTLRAPLQG